MNSEDTAPQDFEPLESLLKKGFTLEPNGFDSETLCLCVLDLQTVKVAGALSLRDFDTGFFEATKR